MDKKPSEYIEEFLRFIREAPTEHRIAESREYDADKETQDILHWTEFYGRIPENREYAEKMQEVLGSIRERRREAKNTAEILEPVVEWGLTHTETVKSLEQLLGEVRKAEKAVKNRQYGYRTEIMAEILEPGEKNCGG